MIHYTTPAESAILQGFGWVGERGFAVAGVKSGSTSEVLAGIAAFTGGGVA